MKNILILITVLIVSIGCNPKERTTVASWGSTSFYDNFLWKKYVPDTLTRTIRFDFNEDSKNHMHEPLVLGIFKKKDNDQYVQVKNDEMQLFVNKQKSEDNTIVVYPSSEELSIGVVFSKNAEDKVHYWYLKVISDGGLNRINGIEPDKFNDSSVSLIEISANKEKICNPLAKCTIFCLLILLLIFFLWILLLRPIFFPVFKINSISIQGDQMSGRFKIRGYRKFIMTPNTIKQNIFEKIFVGKNYYNYFNCTSEIIFEPRDKKSIRVRPDKSFYVDSSILIKQNEYYMKRKDTNEKYKLIIY